MSTFRVETLLASLKEIQQEKSCLEQKLNERRNRRRQLEIELESVNGRRVQIIDRHAKLGETHKVAQHKVAQTQSLASNLDENNQGLKKKISDLNQRIEWERKTQMEEVIQFEDTLSEISNLMVSARTKYSDENLENSLKESEKKEQELNEKFTLYQNRLFEMKTDLERLNNLEEEPCYRDIPLELRKELWFDIQEENKRAVEYLQEIKQKVDNAKQIITNIKVSS